MKYLGSKTLIPWVAIGSILIACQTRNHQEAAQYEPHSQASAALAQAPLALPTPAPSSGCAQKSEGHECGCGVGMAPEVDEVGDGVDPSTGKSMQMVGQKLAGAPVVSVRDLLANPNAYQGKTVRLEGDVSAMCQHRRAWFAVQDDGEREGRYVRVVTAPAFLVPAGSVGRRARTEGRVSVVEVPAGSAKHYAEEHKLGDPSAVRGAERRIVISAFGAEFI